MLECREGLAAVLKVWLAGSKGLVELPLPILRFRLVLADQGIYPPTYAHLASLSQTGCHTKVLFLQQAAFLACRDQPATTNGRKRRAK